MLEYQNTKTFFLKGCTPNWSEEVSCFSYSSMDIVINDLNSEEIIGI